MPDNEQLKQPFFCAVCQADIEHSFTVDKNDEIVATCGTCGHSIKFKLVGSANFADLAATHKEHNVGQVLASVKESADAVKLEALKAFLEAK